jgi:UDP-2,3-diacylglucosamine pyrophosphatase LpxH
MQAENQTRILLIVSDLHLSEGWDEKTKKLSRHEDFFFDQSFKRFLDSYIEKGIREKCRINLIIAGDFVDLLQVISLPNEDTVDGEAITPREREFGLGTSPKKSCWKLRKLMNGHWIFFQALSRFLVAGNAVTIIPGNHDIEFSIPEVQNCLRVELLNYITEKEKDKQDISNLINKYLSFLPWFYYEPGLVYVEHGHQYDSLNSFDYFLHPSRPDNLIDLSAGSFFVRYLFNKVETEYPFADNMKPATRFLRWLLKKMFIRGLFLKKQVRWQLYHYINFFWQTLKKAGPIPSDWVGELEARQNESLRTIAISSGIAEGKLRDIKDKWAKSDIHHLCKCRLFWRFIKSESQNDLYYESAEKVKEILAVQYIVFGHTHEADLEPLEPENWSREYINSGTWTKVFLESYEERLLKEENEFVFVMIDKSGPKMELLRWRDDLGEGERVRLFSTT